jgi:5-methyltetrahydrofolate corrinoid/iron sulfur protein methyltransferase
MLIIGERINSSRKRMAEAIRSRDAEFIRDEALNQIRAGSDYIDINAGSLEDEEDSVKWMVDTLQPVIEKPLCLDSADPKVIKAVLPLVEKTPMINSISLEAARLDSLIPLILERKAKVVALCQSEGELPSTSELKLELAGRLVIKVTDAGIALDDVYIDPLIFSVSTDGNAAIEGLDAIKEIMETFPGVHTVCGMTNISYGLPLRKLINRTFLAMAMLMGLDAAILDPTDIDQYSTLKAAKVLLGQDDFCLEFINDFREGRLKA